MFRARPRRDLQKPTKNFRESVAYFRFTGVPGQLSAALLTSKRLRANDIGASREQKFEHHPVILHGVKQRCFAVAVLGVDVGTVGE